MASRQQAILMMTAVAFGLALLSATQLCVLGVSVSLSELILVFGMIVHLLMGAEQGSNTPARFVPVMVLFVLGTVPGFAVTLATLGRVPFAVYGLLANGWIALLLAYLHCGFDYGRQPLDRLAMMFVSISTVYFCLVLALACFNSAALYLQDQVAELGLDELVGPDDFEPVHLFVGFSSDPNQLAFYSLVCAFFALQLRERMGTVAALVCFAVAAAAGLLAKSDSYVFAMIALLGVAVTMAIFYRRANVLGLLIIVPAATFGLVEAGRIVAEIQEIVSAGDPNLTRVALWTNGNAAGLDRPLIDQGPGAWAGFEGPYETFGSHNSAIEYLTYAGLLGAARLFACAATLWRKALWSVRTMLPAGTVALTILHDMLRHPAIRLAAYCIIAQLWSTLPAYQRRGRRRRLWRQGRRLAV